jgi:hypothetical protein
MPLISHEIPKQLFPLHDLISDYPYVLGHLLKLDKEYADFYKMKLKDAPYSILDNSAFELGSSIPMKELHDLGVEYKPTHLVLPDVVNDYSKTMSNAIMYMNDFKEEDQKYIGVCQGDTFEQIKDCIELYKKLGVDIIALPFDLIEKSDHVTVRYRFFEWYFNQPGVEWNDDIKFHLLGCQNPVEFKLVGSYSRFIYSVDTSSPIINGWVGTELHQEHGLIGPKPKDKLADNLDITLDESQRKLIFKNIKTFKNYFN